MPPHASKAPTVTTSGGRATSPSSPGTGPTPQPGADRSDDEPRQRREDAFPLAGRLFRAPSEAWVVGPTIAAKSSVDPGSPGTPVSIHPRGRAAVSPHARGPVRGTEFGDTLHGPPFSRQGDGRRWGRDSGPTRPSVKLQPRARAVERAGGEATLPGEEQGLPIAGFSPSRTPRLWTPFWASIYVSGGTVTRRAGISSPMTTAPSPRASTGNVHRGIQHFQHRRLAVLGLP